MIEKFIESGLLELYVAGTLSQYENECIYRLMQKNNKINEEVLNIEAALLKLTSFLSIGK